MENNNLFDELKMAIGSEKVISSQDAHTRIANIFGKPRNLVVKGLLLPTNTAEVSAILKICNRYGQAVVPLGGLSNVVKSTETSAEEIAISLEKMNSISEIDTINECVSVEAGVILENLHQAAKAQGLIFGLDLGSKGSCMIGGNIATNAGGLQAVRYGVMRNLVLGLEVVLPDGTVISNMNPVIKNNTGYDLKQLFIGSEGTLGIITKAILKLEKAPASLVTAFIGLSEFDFAQKILKAAKGQFGHNLLSYEILWPEFYEVMTNERSGNKKPLDKKYPLYVLMEIAGIDQKTEENMEQFLEKALEENWICDAAIASKQDDRQRIWSIRDKVDHIMAEHDPVFLFDISLPISEMEAYHDNVQKNLREHFDLVHYYIYGHMGDGNLHLMLNCGDGNMAAKALVEKIVYEPLRNIPSSISAEHGIGISKKEWLAFSRTDAEINLMKAIKSVIDPNGIMNPGKIFS